MNSISCGATADAKQPSQVGQPEELCRRLQGFRATTPPTSLTEGVEIAGTAHDDVALLWAEKPGIRVAAASRSPPKSDF
jgi:hypothetical protein